VLVTSGGDYYGQRGAAELFVWDTATHTIRFKLPATEAFCPAPRLSPSGRHLSRGLNRDGRVEVWDLEERRQLSAFTAHRSLVFASAFSPDESQLATVGDDGFVRLWDWRQGRELATLGRHAAPAVEVVFAPDGRRIVTCGLDSAVRVWDVATRSPQATLVGHMGRLHRVRLSPDGRTVLSGGGGDWTLRFWDAATRTEDTLLERQGQTRADLAFLRDSRTLAVVRPGDGGPTLRLWDLPPSKDGRERVMTREISVTLASVTSVAAGDLLAVGAGPTAIELLEAGAGRAVRRLESPRALLRPLAASPDGAWLAGCTVSNQVVIWEVASGRVARDLSVREILPPGAGSSEMSLVFSGAGRRLWLARSTREDVVAIDWEAGTPPRLLPGHARGVSVLARSSDGAMVASGSHDMTARLWDAGTMEPAGVLRGESGAVTALAFSPDGRTLAMGTFDGHVKLWNVATRLEIATLRAHNSIVYGLAFAPDGSVLASASYDGTTRVWLAPRGD
jgi:WD40 repeat protein